MSAELDYSKTKFASALKKLEEVSLVSYSEIVRDSSAKRFEFCMELAWKTMKIYIRENFGIEVKSPKAIIKEAYRQGMIEYEETWLLMIDWRNDLAHGYEEEYAEKVYKELPNIIKLLNELLKRL